MFEQIVDLEKRKLLAEKLADLANYIAIAFVVGQFLDIKDFSATVLVWGMVVSVFFYWASLAIHPKKYD